MMKKLLPIFLFLWACGPATSDGEPVAGGEDEAGHVEGEPESVHVEPEHMAEWGLEVGSPRLTSVRVELELPGILTTNDNRTARIASATFSGVKPPARMTRRSDAARRARSQSARRPVPPRRPG